MNTNTKNKALLKYIGFVITFIVFLTIIIAITVAINVYGKTIEQSSFKEVSQQEEHNNHYNDENNYDIADDISAVPKNLSGNEIKQ